MWHGDELNILVLEYRIRLQTLRWTRGIKSDDHLNQNVFYNKQGMIEDQKCVLMKLATEIKKRSWLMKRFGRGKPMYVAGVEKKRS